MIEIVIALGLLVPVATAQPNALPMVPKDITEILSRADGASQATAYKVTSVG